MLSALSLAPLTLAAVLVLSGSAKLRDPASTGEMISALRLPRALRHRAVPRALPVVELVTAGLLLTPRRPTYAVGAALALALCAAFLAVIARAMTFRPRPVCGCFGRVGDHRVNGRTLGRNALLLALALVAAWLAADGSPAGALVVAYDTEDRTWLLMALLVATVAVLVLRGAAPPAGRDVEEGRPGVTAPADDRPQADLPVSDRPRVPRRVLLSEGLEPVPLRRLPRDGAQLLVLVDCWCGSTFESIERLPGWRERLPRFGVHLVHTYRPWEEPLLSGVPDVWWDPGAAIYDALGAGSSPSAVLLGTDGRLTAGPVSGVEAVQDLVDRLATEPG